jgi:hypothetical protein
MDSATPAGHARLDAKAEGQEDGRGHGKEI